MASTFTFDASFFEEELLSRFLALETNASDGRAWLVERETRLGSAMAVVLADRRHVSRSSTLAWDLLPVPVERQACQHAKITILAWERHIRAVVGSANLTEAAYRRNLEVFAPLEFHAEGEVPIGVLLELIAFLRLMAERVPDPRDTDPTRSDGPCDRATRLLDTIRHLAEAMGLPTEWRRGSTPVEPVLLMPGNAPGVLEQMRKIWGGGPRPDEVRVLSPFWPAPTESASRSWMREFELCLAARGERTLHLYAPGFEDPASGEWCLEMPEHLVNAARTARRLDVRLRPVLDRQDDENRPLHAKSIWWRREGHEELLLIGSSNASLSGLGIANAARNFEANLCFSATRDARTAPWVRLCFPESPDLDSAACIERSVESESDEGGRLPLPGFFQWACFERRDQDSTLRVALGGGDEPEDWSLSALDGRVDLDRSEHQRVGSPAVWSTDLAVDANKEAPPALITVQWRDETGLHLGHLPVNALDDGSRSRPDLWLEIDLDTLLELLAAGGSIHRQLLKILQRRESAGRVRLAAELDPHRKVDTSRFLMQRIRRISRGLEGLYEKLAQPVHSEAALEFRFRGPLGPSNLTRRLIAESPDVAEQSFLLAEVALVVGRAAQVVEGIGISTAAVRDRYRAAASELRSMLPTSTERDPLDDYVARAFIRALAGAGA